MAAVPIAKNSERLLSQAAGLFLVGFSSSRIDPELVWLLQRGLRGVVLFSRNVDHPLLVLDLTERLMGAAGRPLVIAVDQEGGRVQRLGPPFLQLPPMRTLGRLGDEALCRLLGWQLGRELRAAGLWLNFAPVLDLDTNPHNPVIGDRAFGSDPRLVGRLGLALASGLRRAWVASCAKHFPGHGDTAADSHRELPLVEHPLSRLRRWELKPFARAARARLPFLMMAHLRLPALDRRWPTSLSPAAYRLARQLGYRGLVLTDDLEMAAIAQRWGIEEAAGLALRAGADGVLVCHQPQLAARAVEAIVRLAERSSFWRRRLQEAERRWQRVLRQYRADRLRPSAQRLHQVQDCALRHRLDKILLGLG